MKSFIKYITETQISPIAQHVQDVLTSDEFMGNDFNYTVRDRKTSQPANVIVIDVDGSDRDRIKMFNDITDRINQNKTFDSAVYNKKPITGGISCTKGAIEITASDQNGRQSLVKVIVKSKNHTGSGTAGVENEHQLIDAINQYCENGPISVKFFEEKNPKKQFVFDEVYKAESIGTDTSDNKKGDIKLYGKAGSCVISIKKLTAEFWASCTKKGNPTAEMGALLLEALLEEKRVNDTYAQTNEAAADIPRIKLDCAGVTWPLNEKQAQSCVFGSDIKDANGCVVEQTFDESNIKFDADSNTLNILSERVIASLDDIPADDYPWFFIQNSVNHTLAGKYRGVRLLAARYRRVKSGNIYHLTEDEAKKLIAKQQEKQEI